MSKVSLKAPANPVAEMYPVMKSYFGGPQPTSQFDFMLHWRNSWTEMRHKNTSQFTYSDLHNTDRICFLAWNPGIGFLREKSCGKACFFFFSRTCFLKFIFEAILWDNLPNPELQSPYVNSYLPKTYSTKSFNWFCRYIPLVFSPQKLTRTVEYLQYVCLSVFHSFMIQEC